MHRAREIVHCMGICLLLTGCQPEPDSQGGEVGIMPIPESEYELFSDLVHKIQTAEASLNQSLNTLDQQKITSARETLAYQHQVMSNLFVARYGESRVTQWKETMIRIEEDKQIRETAKMRGRELLKEFERYGAHGQLDAEEYIVSLYCQETVIPNHLLSRLANCPRVTTLDFSNSPIRDSKLKLIGRVHSLAHLNLSGCPINGSGLKFLAGLHNLKSINLSTTSLSTNAHNQLKALVSLENLDTLELNECALSTSQFEKILRMFKKTDVRF